MASKQFFFLFCIFMSMVGKDTYAASFSAQNSDGVTIYYNIIEDGSELEVSYKYKGEHNRYSGVVVIPSEVIYNNRVLKVTSIGDEAFYNCYNLISVTIPNSVNTIGKRAFYGCI
jgi:hypothetical protein